MTQIVSAIIPDTAAVLIRADPRRQCYLCDSPGEMLYQRMRDRLLNSPGEWNMRRCSKRDCGLLWLDPMPKEEDIGTAYETYYTHEGVEDTPRPPPFTIRRRAAELCRSAYLAFRFNYGNDARKPLRWLLAVPILMSRIECDGLDFPLRYLAVAKKGRMLDVGCGNGSVLKVAQELGWNAEGVDFDPRAVDAAGRKGLTVRLGRLADQRYPATSFHFVLLSHVIEHVHDPLATLAEIHRILRPGGKLVVATPNADSWGHRHFGVNWRGLEPPRHLQIFDRKTLGAITQRAGFDQVAFSTSLRITPNIFIPSRLARSGRRDLIRPPTRSEVLYGRIATVAELLMRIWNPLVAEELVLEARK
jgi:2-polyprenyl-3-methyl-5-hydroxy-6-metoxy-1,4-benzoquinol methylase